jgi:hypothetical protein
MDIFNLKQVAALVSAAALEPTLAHLPEELRRSLTQPVADAKTALESMFREQAGYYIGDNVSFGLYDYRLDALVIKEGLVAVELRKLKKDGTPSTNVTWEWFSGGLRRA